ncbi:MAG TPA: hypothetical protein VIC62_12040 [Nakamurella sp.]|jgi:hypothetical protein
MLMASRQLQHDEMVAAVRREITRSLKSVGDLIGACVPARIKRDPGRSLRWNRPSGPIRSAMRRARSTPDGPGAGGKATTMIGAVTVGPTGYNEVVAQLELPLKAWTDPRRRVCRGRRSRHSPGPSASRSSG